MESVKFLVYVLCVCFYNTQTSCVTWATHFLSLTFSFLIYKVKGLD